MKLMTKAIEDRFAKLGRQEEKGDSAIVVAKFFDPTGSWTWYATEYDPAERVFFGLVHGFEDELGYFSLDELSSVRGRFGLGIERDLHWTECPLSEVRLKAASL